MKIAGSMGGSRAALRLVREERTEPPEDRGRSGLEWLRVASLFGLAASLLALAAAALGA